MLKLGERIRRIRKLKHMSQVALEGKTGIKREYLSKLENAELKNPTYKTLLKICAGLGISLTDLVRAEGESQFTKQPPLKVVVDAERGSQAKEAVGEGSYVTIPLISHQVAALGSGYIELDDIEQYVVLPQEYIPPTTDTSRFRCVRLASGDYSMSPIMEPETIVGIDSHCTDPHELDGKLALLRLSEGECGVRRIRLGGNYVVALPQNLKEYAPLVLPFSKKQQPLGRIIWCLSRFGQCI